MFCAAAKQGLSFSGLVTLSCPPFAPRPGRGDYTLCLSKSTQHNLSISLLDENRGVKLASNNLGLRVISCIFFYICHPLAIVLHLGIMGTMWYSIPALLGVLVPFLLIHAHPLSEQHSCCTVLCVKSLEEAEQAIFTSPRVTDSLPILLWHQRAAEVWPWMCDQFCLTWSDSSRWNGQTNTFLFWQWADFPTDHI